jgi:diguanylate cyclase (GGDEF)-like protein
VAHRIQAMQRRPDDLFASLILDLDRFKVVNDSLGHVPADQLLQGASERIKQCLRAADTLGRLGVMSLPCWWTMSRTWPR